MYRTKMWTNKQQQPMMLVIAGRKRLSSNDYDRNVAPPLCKSCNGSWLTENWNLWTVSPSLRRLERWQHRAKLSLSAPQILLVLTPRAARCFDDGWRVPRLQVRYVLWHDCCYGALVNFDFVFLLGRLFWEGRFFRFRVRIGKRAKGAKESEEFMLFGCSENFMWVFFQGQFSGESSIRYLITSNVYAIRSFVIVYDAIMRKKLTS